MGRLLHGPGAAPSRPTDAARGRLRAWSVHGRRRDAVAPATVLVSLQAVHLPHGRAAAVPRTPGYKHGRVTALRPDPRALRALPQCRRTLGLRTPGHRVARAGPHSVRRSGDDATRAEDGHHVLQRHEDQGDRLLRLRADPQHDGGPERDRSGNGSRGETAKSHQFEE